MINLHRNLDIAIIGIFSLLILASVITYVMTKIYKEKDLSELTSRVKSWWIMLVIFSLAMVVNRTISLIFLAFISFLALKEYLSLIPTRRSDRRVLFWCYAMIPVQFYIISTHWYGLFIVFIPVFFLLFLPIRMIMLGETTGFLNAIGTLHWGMMMTVYSIGHAGFLLVLPERANPIAGGAGLLFFLVVVTQLNDVAQYLWGKMLGKRKVVPKVSPGKTVAGLIGGVLSTALVAYLIAPYITPLDPIKSVIVGLGIGLAGFIGDVTISAVKRDIGVKDAGSLLPGHGGILDRIDSLTYTAPLFFHYIYYYYI